jgi:hypothetical protein
MNLEKGIIEDDAFECMVIRAYLDAFWSRTTTTVQRHLAEVRYMIRYGKAFRFDPLPPLGPFPLGAHLGMLQAVLVEMRSMEKGQKEDSLVKYGTARKIRSTQTVLWESSPLSGADITLSTGSVKGRYVATMCPSESRWYQRFETGIAIRIGDVVSQDRAFTLDVLLELVRMYEDEWNQWGNAIPLNKICACMFLLVSCLGGMRGFEVMWTDLAALRYDVRYCLDRNDKSGISWPVIGRFKARDGFLDCYMIPIAGKTKSGINFFEWTERFLGRLELEGRTDGWAFMRANGERAKAADYRRDIFTKLEKIQETTDLIDPGCNVWEEYGEQRSGRRCFVLVSTINKIPRHVMELQCRWMTDRENGVRTVQRSMIHNYSEVRNMLSVLIRPSKAF